MSAIATIGVFVGAAALIIVLSVFNGFETLVTSLYNSFDADYVITPQKGKTFIPDSTLLKQLSQLDDVALVGQVLEENVLLKNGDKQYFAVIKGVTPQIAQIKRIQNLIIDGKLILESGGIPYSCLGQGVAVGLSLTSNNSMYPLTVYVPNRLTKPDLSNTANAFKILNINVSSVFSVQQDVDSKLVLAPISFLRQLLDYDKEVNAIEIYVHNNTTNQILQKKIQTLIGPRFIVKNKEQQHELLYKIMKSEKLAVFSILVFILIVASFNVIGSLTMLIIDKKKDIAVLKSLGAKMSVIKNIFLFQGMLITFYGAVGGILLGLLVCLLQQHLGLISLGNSGSFVIDSYPVKIIFTDVLYVLITVLLIGFTASLIASQNISKIEEEGIAGIMKQEQ